MVSYTNQKTKIFYSSFFHIILVFLNHLWKDFCNNLLYINLLFLVISSPERLICLLCEYSCIFPFFHTVLFFLDYLLNDNNFSHTLFRNILFFFVCSEKKLFHYVFSTLYKHSSKYLFSLSKIDLINITTWYIFRVFSNVFWLLKETNH